MSGAGGAAGRFAAFMAGGWGTAILGAVALGGLLVNALAGTAGAHNKSACVAKSNTDAIRDNNAALAKSIQSTQGADAAARGHAISLLQGAVALRTNTKALLENAIARAFADKTRSQGTGQRGELGALAAVESQNQVAKYQKLLADNDKSLASALGILTMMADAAALLDGQLRSLSRSVLNSGGRVSNDATRRHAEAEYDKYKAAQKRIRHERADQDIRALKTIDQALPRERKAK